MSNLKEREKKAAEEYEKVIDWAIAEGDKVIEQLEKEGATIGLDGHQERFAYIKDYKREKLKEIIAKYDLPYEVKW